MNADVRHLDYRVTDWKRIENRKVTKMAKKMNGRVLNMAAVAEQEKTRDFVAEGIAHKESGTFTITVKDADGKVAYTNDKEPFDYLQVGSLVDALKMEGAVIDASQVEFINSALTGDENGKAMAAILKIYNADLKASAKSSAYASVFNEHKPVTEESISNAKARMVRDFIRTSGGSISAETAIQVLNANVWKDSPYTLEEFEANKGRV